MNDFLKGYSQGMTGSTSGLPSQSVMEAMGRDAARNQWSNNTNRQTSSGGAGYSGDDDVELIPVTTVLYEAGKKMRFRKLARGFLIGLLLSVGAPLFNILVPVSLKWVLGIVSFIGFLFMFWALLRLPFYLIGKIGTRFEKAKAAEAETVPAPEKD